MQNVFYLTTGFFRDVEFYRNVTGKEYHRSDAISESVDDKIVIYSWWFRECMENFIAYTSVGLGKTCHNTESFMA